VCGFGDAEVKEDKNSHAFIYCTDCSAQTFTRNDARDKKLRARMRPVTVTVTEPAATTPPVPLPTDPPVRPIPTAPPAAKPVPTAAPTPSPNPAPARKGGWFDTLITTK
jgi:hypothetical protein